jgi:hypothetical protein
MIDLDAMEDLQDTICLLMMYFITLLLLNISNEV